MYRSMAIYVRTFKSINYLTKLSTNNFSKHMLSLLVLLTGVIYHSEQISIFSTISSQRHNSYYKHDDDT